MAAEHQIAYFLRELGATEADPQRRAAAAKGLGRMGRIEHAVHLARAAGDREPAVRAAAAQGLGRLGAAETGADVLPGLMGDEDPDVRRRASLAAIRLGLRGRTVTEAFTRLLRDPDRHVRINALVGLEALDIPYDVPALVDLLGDPDEAVWGRAGTLVYRWAGDPAVRAQVIRTARDGVGAARARALDMLPARCTEPLLDSLLAGLRDPSPQVRTAVARRLFHADSGTVGDALAAAVEDEREPEVAALLLSGLARRGDERATGPAVRWLRDPLAGPAAARALGGLDTPDAAEHLRTALDDPTLPGATRAAAAVAVGESGAWDAVWQLLPLLDDPDATTRAGVVDALGASIDGGLRLWERHPVAWALADHLTSDGADVWRTRNALDGLAQALPSIRRLADGAPSGEVRAAALSLLDADDATDTNSRKDVRRFVRGLDDPHEAVRYQAALGLTRWTTATREPPPDSAGLRERLHALTVDDSPRLRRAATDALAALAPGTGG
ncbi:HEAT repeat domain-containing protein [Streptomyces sp. NPDC058676]|uniref:HEAT repeat domain-containing protein n=1 Tax=unclassified Streptomyces TaxID=2593676 RepID=UPI00365F90B2